MAGSAALQDLAKELEELRERRIRVTPSASLLSSLWAGSALGSAMPGPPWHRPRAEG